MGGPFKKIIKRSSCACCCLFPSLAGASLIIIAALILFEPFGISPGKILLHAPKTTFAVSSSETYIGYFFNPEIPYVFRTGYDKRSAPAETIRMAYYDYAVLAGSAPSMKKILVRNHMAYFLFRAAKEGKIAHLALEPTAGWPDGMPSDEEVAALADLLGRSGARILLRFGGEMNGSWTRYHDNPEAYVREFRRLAEALHSAAPNALMVWAPNSIPGDVFSKNSPWYPGDAFVDVIGVSAYFTPMFPSPAPDVAANRPIDEIAEEILGPASKMAARRGKPFMVAEFGAASGMFNDASINWIPFASEAGQKMYEEYLEKYDVSFMTHFQITPEGVTVSNMRNESRAGKKIWWTPPDSYLDAIMTNKRIASE